MFKTGLCGSLLSCRFRQPKSPWQGFHWGLFGLRKETQLEEEDSIWWSPYFLFHTPENLFHSKGSFFTRMYPQDFSQDTKEIRRFPGPHCSAIKRPSWSVTPGSLLLTSVYTTRAEQGMTTHSRILAWRIPETEEPGGLRSMGSQRVGHDWSRLAHTHILRT